MTKLPSALVSTEWLADNLGAPGLAVLDASYHLPAAARDAGAEFAAGHIPGARFLGLASLFDAGSSVPYAFPTPDQLAARLGLLGVRGEDAIILYDDSAIRTSARAWFVLTAMGWDKVAILDGGLGKWRAEGRALGSGAEHGATIAPVNLAPPRRVRSKADMLANIASGREQVLDARGADRVYGTGIDPVHGGPNGRIPGALNLPFGGVLNADGTYKSPDDIRAALTAAGIDLDQPVTTTCGSGVTASVLMFAMHLIGKHDTALYDGSWSEWGADPDTPKLQGPAE
ncbi:thiosulfate/3-mercaptopyruvate sulfurtransferase [Erythromicrobium ramosum]|uniref:Sulfurtransferase n=1 Tax=Erythrobacter ramosus TaxID=35811 RepID=A0A6I4UMU2_9SPHN|nr:sulfurtransferase [Erythrobacter ramosus]MBB3776854.1 thiosulfate/3-mercaptopyruvate sulfurtransferase [Erythrobacter ramosus]MXP39706.1 sulfurtransferase [Erythrobacter ramosus]